MQVSDVMSRNVQTAAPGSNLTEAATTMLMLDVGVLPVWDGNGLVGIVTDRDITIRGVAIGLDPCTARVDDVMTPRVLTCLENCELSLAAKIMEDNRVRRLVVVDAEGTPIGIVSMGDVALHLQGTDLVTEVVRKVSEP